MRFTIFDLDIFLTIILFSELIMLIFTLQNVQNDSVIERKRKEVVKDGDW